MIQVKMKGRTEEKMDKHLQSHSPAQLCTKKYHSFFPLFGNFILGSTHYSLFGWWFELKFKPGRSRTFTFYTSALWTTTHVPIAWQLPGLTSHVIAQITLTPRFVFASFNAAAVSSSKAGCELYYVVGERGSDSTQITVILIITAIINIECQSVQIRGPQPTIRSQSS